LRYRQKSYAKTLISMKNCVYHKELKDVCVTLKALPKI